jgi:hypothetical protein
MPIIFVERKYIYKLQIREKAAARDSDLKRAKKKPVAKLIRCSFLLLLLRRIVYLQIEEESMHTIVHVGLQATKCWSCHSYTLAQCGYGDVVVAGQGISMHTLGDDQGEWE